MRTGPPRPCASLILMRLRSVFRSLGGERLSGKGPAEDQIAEEMGQLPAHINAIVSNGENLGADEPFGTQTQPTCT